MSRSIRYRQLIKAYKVNGPLVWRDYAVGTYTDEFFDDDDDFDYNEYCVKTRPTDFEPDVYIF